MTSTSAPLAPRTYEEGFADGIREALSRSTSPRARRQIAGLLRSQRAADSGLAATRLAYLIRSLVLKEKTP